MSTLDLSWILFGTPSTMNIYFRFRRGRLVSSEPGPGTTSTTLISRWAGLSKSSHTLNQPRIVNEMTVAEIIFSDLRPGSAPYGGHRFRFR